VVILDDGADWPDGFTYIYDLPRGIRPETARVRASAFAERNAYQLIDCLAGETLPQKDEIPSKEDEITF
jgi:hypothetical protein